MAPQQVDGPLEDRFGALSVTRHHDGPHDDDSFPTFSPSSTVNGRTSPTVAISGRVSSPGLTSSAGGPVATPHPAGRSALAAAAPVA
jgi:hypothetical protein